MVDLLGWLIVSVKARPAWSGAAPVRPFALLLEYRPKHICHWQMTDHWQKRTFLIYEYATGHDPLVC